MVSPFHVGRGGYPIRLNSHNPAPAPAADSDQTRWFADEVYAHDSQLRAYVRSKFPAIRDVDDVVQESYLRVWRARLARPIASAKAFLFQVARNLAIDAAREKSTSTIDTLRDLAALDVIEDGPNAADALCYREKVSLIVTALEQLPARCREVIIARKFNRIPQRDIAMKLGISERTVESHVTRGMSLIEAYLRRQGVSGFSRDE